MVVIYSVMNSGLCDGMPANYTSSPTSDATGNPRRLCTTQSPDGDPPTLESFYTASPILDAAETVQPQQHPSHILPTLNTAAAIQTYPQIHSASSSTSSMIATPPSTAGVDHEEYTYQESTGSCGPAHVPALSVRSSNTSPRSWSSPDLQQLTYAPGFYLSKGQEFPPYGGPQAAITTEDSFSTQAMETCTYSVSSSPLPGDYKNEPDTIMGQEAPGMTPDHTDSVISADSPLPKHECSSSSYPYEENGDGSMPPHAHEPDENDVPEGDERANEPAYAKLMERAFLSKASRSMTLQELYQWFRDNTEKGQSTSKGWQNSIRHNLSMNQAFEKRERRPSVGGPTTGSGEPRRSNEWVLAAWAERGGVQSTTRYRNANANGTRRARSSRSHNQQGSVSARAASGRKGGLTASKTKAANNRALLKAQRGIVPQHHQYHSGGSGSGSSYQQQQQQQQHGHNMAYYQPRLHHHEYVHGGHHHLHEADYTRSIPHHRDESESSEGSLLQYAGHHPMTSSMTSIGSGQGYYHTQPQPYLTSQASQQQQQQQQQSYHQHHEAAAAYSQQQQHQPPHPYHSRPETHFKVEHATSVYEPPVTSSPSSAAIHGVYANVFANDIGEGTPENPVRPTPLPYRTSSHGWAANGHSQ